MIYKGRTALITGASSGIGLAFAEEMASQGANLVLVARREGRLRDISLKLSQQWNVQVNYIVSDLAKVESPNLIIDKLELEKINIDILINNAGYGVPDYYLARDWKTHSDFLALMVNTVAHLTHLLLEGMVSRGYGRVLNVSSLAALVPGTAGHTLYNPSKSFMVKFTESLYIELIETGVKVSVVCPGYTFSEFHELTGQKERRQQLPSFMWMDAEAVVKSAILALEKSKVRCIPGVWNKLVAAFMGLVPHSLALYIIILRAKRDRPQIL